MIYTVTLNTNESVAGKGINISLVLKKLGVASIATGIVASDGEKVKQELDQEKIEHHFIKQDQAAQLDLFSSTETQVSAQKQQELLDYLKKSLKMGDILVVAGSFAPGIDPVYLTDLAKLAQEKMTHLVVDVPYVNVLDILPLHPLLVKPNTTELKSWFKKENDNLTTEQLVDLAHDMVVRGADHVLLSLGADGAAIVNLMHAYIAQAPEINKVNEDGAGETLLATFLAGMLQNHTPVRNLADSIAAATDTVQSQRLTTFEKTAELQRQIIARKITFEEAE
ncbi:PfkB family carbohydrate kinase [uncultured Lactobacillus sp.]|uniref:PfkB family carbohydrate kinase n=1 Tax=uncultured Lactobacillus sp. TaxID=153152 RepID=UPI0026112A5A|nr:PfkB family carbohydrate kinase [uncultured Lactobacillus sp.]